MENALIPSGSPPQKWLKYELLDLFGLTDIAYLRKAIHRMPRSEHAAFFSQLSEAVRTAAQQGSPETLFVVKFVPKRRAMMLPNVRVNCVADLQDVKRAIRDGAADYEELWFCRTNVSTSSLSVAGRVVVDSTAGSNAQVIEQVWRCSPRLIETLGPAFPYPFVRARRLGWGWSTRIDQIHLPSSAPESRAVLLQQLRAALLKLNEVRDQLELFSDAIAALGLPVCLEYKVEDRRLQIIDWDTPNDSLVLAELLPK